MASRSFYPLAGLLALALVGVIVGVRFVSPPAAPAAYELGSGPRIVMVHGLGSRVDDWLPVARELARTHRVMLVELPGHGMSEMPDPFSLARVAECLDRALAPKGEESVLIVGHSLGGLVAVQEALARPDRVRGLVLIESALKPTMSEGDRRGMLAALQSDFSGLLRDAYLSFGRDSAQGLTLWQRAREENPAMMKSWITLALTTDLSQAAHGLRAPVLAIVSDRSWTVGETRLEAEAALGLDHVPSLELQRLARSGHFVMLDRPAEVASFIERFSRRATPEPVALATAR